MTRESYNLIGAVHKIEAESAMFEFTDGKLIEGRYQSSSYAIFNIYGRLVEESNPLRSLKEGVYKDIYFYDNDGKLGYRQEYDFNLSLIGKTVFEYTPEGNRIEKLYGFNNLGNTQLVQHIIFDGNTHDEESIVEIAHYDENGLVIPEHVYRDEPAGKIKKNKIVTEDGFQIEELRQVEKKEHTAKVLTSYDSKGNRLEFSCFDSNGKLTIKDEYEFEFDLVGNWIKQIQKHWVIGWGEFKTVPLSIGRRKIDYYK